MNLDLIELKRGEFRYDDRLYLSVDVVIPAETYGVLQTLYLVVAMPDGPSVGEIALRLRDLGLANDQTHCINISIPPADPADDTLHNMLSDAAKAGRYFLQTKLTFAAEEETSTKAPRTLVPP
ncbi:hypothetical protein H2509_02575 [Stappia sp. F7233]|uniref:Uncharacterized protein n=1 Tax=Stappia albiluteola TaxID=2758565 RepID=A0A839A9Z7_9HYPH|nr:hypothetical protein [Stappia albiluteola]MBA5776006.1 hypothetical protein [Stappia albiluteola]